MPGVSILILTLNEEDNVAACLRSVAWSDDVVVFDSFSKDRTTAIAREMGARVVERKFDNWAAHQNWAMANVPWKHDWVFYLDADERMTEPLRTEIEAIAADATEKRVAFYGGRKNFFMGGWAKRAMPPSLIMRFFKPPHIRFERLVNPTPVIDGPHGYLKGMFLHYNFSKGLREWFIKHNSYSQMEAVEGEKLVHGRPDPGGRSLLRQALIGDRANRRKALKALSFFLPFRAFARFVYMYFAKLGLLDGRAGFHYSLLISMYEYWIQLKMQEIEHKGWKRQNDRIVNRRLAAFDGNALSAPDRLPRIDVFIPTFNESHHIAEAVANAKQLGGGVYVLDSKSTDGTQDLARAAGATVVERTFTNYADQKNWGLDNLPLTGDWVFILDADERITPELAAEIFEKTASRRSTTGYFVNRVVIAMGKQVRHGGLYPSWNLRLFRRGTARYEERIVHEHMVSTGPVDFLRHEMLHLRRESISRFIDKHVRYADLEADEWVKWRTGNSTTEPAGSLFSNLLAVRQWFRRNIWPRLPGRPLWRFMYMYFFRFGFLDGLAGWHMARLMACYEYMIGLLYAEKLAKLKGKDLGRSGGEHEAIGYVPVSKS
ncbi:MAG TPA: glycosyltransferase family 2 protein [Tepidisphaeraceae bacterium]|nr:glycosyltransferase family 2 protein [Tepidisphaeraceae bacterium]